MAHFISNINYIYMHFSGWAKELFSTTFWLRCPSLHFCFNRMTESHSLHSVLFWWYYLTRRRACTFPCLRLACGRTSMVPPPPLSPRHHHMGLAVEAVVAAEPAAGGAAAVAAAFPPLPRLVRLLAGGRPPPLCPVLPRSRCTRTTNIRTIPDCRQLGHLPSGRVTAAGLPTAPSGPGGPAAKKSMLTFTRTPTTHHYS